MEIINLTPHIINDVEGNVNYPPSGTIARVEEGDVIFIETINGSAIYKRKLGKVAGLPEITLNTLYIVSFMVADALKDRSDLICPGTPVRDEEGKIIGCKGFFANNY